MDGLDSLLLKLINHPAGHNLALDTAVFDLSESTIMKGGIFAAVYLWLWFEGGKSDRSGQRRDVVVAITGGIIAAVISRLLQVAIPFHQRPLHTAGLDLHVPHVVNAETLNTFSSLPSDHAVLFFALSVPLWKRSHWLAIVAALWTLLVICLPRIYLGFHWPSDVIAGAIIGLLLMLFLQFMIGATALPDKVLRMEAAYPAVFYTLAWLILLELAVMFTDLRHFAVDAVQIAKM